MDTTVRYVVKRNDTRRGDTHLSFFSLDSDITGMQVLLDMAVWIVMAESKNGSR